LLLLGDDRLLGFAGPEGDEARLVMKSLRVEAAQQHGLHLGSKPLLSPSPSIRRSAGLQMTRSISASRPHLSMAHRQSLGSAASHASSVVYDPFAHYLDDSGQQEEEMDVTGIDFSLHDAIGQDASLVSGATRARGHQHRASSRRSSRSL
jgi:hypothetical protein